MPHISRFLKFTSQRSGFDGMRIGMLKDNPWIVKPEEFDTPPPSKKPLGGEGDIATGAYRVGADFSSVSDTDTPVNLDNPTVAVTAAGGITPNPHPFMLVAGSNTAIDITANPQIAAGAEGDVLTLFCVGSNITLDNGTGLSLMGSSRFVMTSGAVITFIYNTANTAWNETSRSPVGGI